MLCICPLVGELTSVMLTRAHQRSKPNTPNTLEEHDSYWNIASLDTWQQGHIHIVDHNWQFVVLAIIKPRAAETLA